MTSTERTILRIAYTVLITVAFIGVASIAQASDRTSDVRIIGGRPAACEKFPATRRRYCGCAAALYIGLPNERGQWNKASAWFKFKRARPGPGMAVVRKNHVAIIIGGSDGAWKLYDPNSGGGLTRVHVRPLFGVVVNPTL